VNDERIAEIEQQANNAKEWVETYARAFPSTNLIYGIPPLALELLAELRTEREKNAEAGNVIAELREALADKRGRLVPIDDVLLLDVEAISRQRARGWVDFHPEDFCHQCGRRFHYWHAPDWYDVQDGALGIICPVCFIDNARATGNYPDGTVCWTLTPVSGSSVNKEKP
jgi:hypothetical protein